VVGSLVNKNIIIFKLNFLIDPKIFDKYYYNNLNYDITRSLINELELE
jgi:hypothetical protein